MSKDASPANSLSQAALDYHRRPTPGKLAVTATKPLTTQRDLALAYSPGVAAACDLIVSDPAEVRSVTSRGNLVAVITNGTAVLGLGNIGPLAAKPVMEGKAVLFKKFAGIDVFDIEIAENDVDKLIDMIAALEPTFGAINLEDIKAPECFIIERRLRERMNIPVFHDDQHGTAIVSAAAMVNALEVLGKRIGEVSLVCSGAGAAAIACLDLLVSLGLDRNKVIICDSKGVVYDGRPGQLDESKARYARDTNARSLADALVGADVFLGLSGPGLVTREMAASMAAKPIIMALANPTPEILPEEVKAVRSDAVIATGRSDYPNQVNNVLCFPFIFRGALDVGATTINEAMKIACVRALANLAKQESSDVVAAAYRDQTLSFGPDYLIPKPFDPRLIVELAPAVARAAVETGVATRPIVDFAAYRLQLEQFVFQSSLVMRPVFNRARLDPRRIAYAEGEDERTLRAVQIAVDEGLARPILIGRRAVVERRIERLGLRLRLGRDIELADPEDDPRYNDYWNTYHQLLARHGVTPARARTDIRTDTTAIAAVMVHRAEADSMICGLVGPYRDHLRTLLSVFGLRRGVRTPASMTALILPDRTLFVADTHVTPDPTAEQIAEITALAAEEVRRFGIAPKVALVSHSNFGSVNTASAQKMSAAVSLIRAREPELEVDGEMHADAALDEAIRNHIFPGARLRGSANLLIMPTLDAAHIAFNIVKVITGGVPVGPILLGVARSAQLLSQSTSMRGIVNMTALATVDAQAELAAGRQTQPGLVPRELWQI